MPHALPPEEHSRYQLFFRKADLYRDMRFFLINLQEEVSSASTTSSLVGLDYSTLPDGTVKGVVGLGIFVYDASSGAAPDGVNVLDTGLPLGRWIKYTTGASVAGNYTLTRVAFSWASPGIVTLVGLPVGTIIDGATVEVTTPFDGVGASLQVGTGATPGLFFGPGKTSLTLAKTFTNRLIHQAAVAESLILSLNGAGSTVGSGFVSFHVRSI